MASTYSIQQDPHEEAKRYAAGAAYQAPSTASRKYYDYFAMPSSPQSRLSSSKLDAQRARKNDLHSSSADSVLRALVEAPPTGHGCAATTSKAVPRALPVQPSPRTLNKQGDKPYHLHSHSHSHSFDYYKTTNRRAPPPSALMTSSSTHAVRRSTLPSR